ncbi:hypothetical protein T552_01538 [Pneumocystis carinii B80]|uniref:FHA domain-containing protein n=1 Tax=Pneumocystis carinii (strain B80) TaxID=1408658 RepID=A0A0W4ZKK6_PNEC8|nr:hypothetical protein T552_01538 [Pneumocystis carinii B80]KTW28911.1 hypothetical protein T552_01538 [Pneumocystis carinii B80]
MADSPLVCLILAPINDTFERKCLWLPSWPQTLRIGRQINSRTAPAPNNGFFDSKVLSRAHAEVWADPKTGSVFIRDIKSSNGTFLNGRRLSQENQTSEPFELYVGDVLELGIDILNEEDRSILHYKVASRVEHAGWAEMNSLDVSQEKDNGLWVDTGTTEAVDTITLRVLVSNEVAQSKSVLEEDKMNECIGKDVENILQTLNIGLKTAKQQMNDIKLVTKMLNNIQDTVFYDCRDDSLEKIQPEDILKNHSDNFGNKGNLKCHKKSTQPLSLEVLASKQLEIEEKTAKIKCLEEEKTKQQTCKQIIEQLLKEQNNTLEVEDTIETKMNTELMKNKLEKDENSEDELKSLKAMVENMKKEIELWKYRAKRTEKIVEQSTYHMTALLKTGNENINEVFGDKLWITFFPACCIVMIGISIMCYLNDIAS